MSPYRIVFGKAYHLRLRLNIEPTGQLRSETWPTTKPTMKGNCSCRNWKSCTWKHMRTLGSTKKRILRKEFRVGQKVLLFNSQLKLKVGKFRSRWDEPFVVTNIFPYGLVELRDEANNRNFKVNGHQIKPYYEGLNSNLEGGKVKIISLVEPVILEDTL
ncbi:hypothetical protein CR513_04367, partial [Mucuna pruriens]